ncbi:MAG: hypothetical protein EU543_03510 [Promethearchaeota archaeon]|nr:MAG: hypothetical protein EU543_03510 [Candidatus Lokiarchaeota archaeon]
MSKDNTIGKVLALISGLLGLLCVLGYYLIEELGAWWKIESIIGDLYINAFGYRNDNMIFSEINFISGIIFLIGTVLILFNIVSTSKKVSLISFVVMVIGLILYYIGLSLEYEEISGDIPGFVSWGLGIGFYIGIGATILALISAVDMD